MLLVWGICQNEDLRSAVVVGLPHNSLKSLLHWRWLNFLADGPDWHLWSWAGVWLSLITCGDVCSDKLELHGFKLFRIKCWRRRCWICKKKSFPVFHVCPKCLAARFCGSAFPENGSAFHQDLDEEGRTLVDWQRGIVHCVLIQHLENISNHSCNWFRSVIPEFLPVSSRIVSRYSINLLLEIVSNVEPWNRFNSSISLRLYHELHESPNFASITVHEEVDDLVEVVRLLDEHDKFLLFVTRSFHATFEYFFCRNRLGIRVFESLLDGQRESALFVDPEESWFAHFLRCGSEFLWRFGLVNQTDQQQVALFWHDWQTTTYWTTNLRQESDKLVYGSLVLLAPGWTVVKRAPCRWWRHRTRSHSGTHFRPRIPGCMVQ